jgi:hypothetical protein
MESEYRIAAPFAGCAIATGTVSSAPAWRSRWKRRCSNRAVATEFSANSRQHPVLVRHQIPQQLEFAPRQTNRLAIDVHGDSVEVGDDVFAVVDRRGRV